jgi:hypothetical protein
MSGERQIGFPAPAAAITDATGHITPAWLQLFRSMWSQNLGLAVADLQSMAAMVEDPPDLTPLSDSVTVLQMLVATGDAADPPPAEALAWLLDDAPPPRGDDPMLCALLVGEV